MEKVFTTRERENLFLKLAGTETGVTSPEVYEAAVEAGDKVTREAYQNLARRLVHRGVLVADDGGKVTRYRLGQRVDSYWLDEEELAGLMSDDYPLLSLPIWSESQRQIRDIPEDWWLFLRSKLLQEPARDLFARAILAYCQDFKAAVEILAEDETNGGNPTQLARMKEEARNSLLLLLGLVRFGLGLSIEAVRLPDSVEEAVARLQGNSRDDRALEKHPVGWDEEILRAELTKRISDESFLAEEYTPGASLLIAAVDGSTRGGVMTSIEAETDFNVGHAPMISINTAIGQVNRYLRGESGDSPVFLRLPEKPEDIQQRDNKYTVMAKLYYPDLSDAEYMHSLWNAMDVLESKATLRIMSRWFTSPSQVEVPPADVVLRDGTIVPQDRDFAHYGQSNRYGEIVRDLIGTNWDIAMRCKAGLQTVAGVVKSANLRVYGPVLNWYVKELAARRDAGPLQTWPMNAMNAFSDQMLISRLLSARRSVGSPWCRTCLVLRPFHATTNFAKRYSTRKTPIQIIEERRARALQDVEAGAYVENRLFWEFQFKGENDAYVQMLSNVWIANFFLANVPRLDAERYLPRMEFLVPSSTMTNSAVFTEAEIHLCRLMSALRKVGHDVSSEHSMFQDRTTLEVLPELIARAHDTVKIWARELLNRVDEYLAALIGQHIGAKRARGIRVRPFTKEELKMLHETILAERKRVAEGSRDRRLSN